MPLLIASLMRSLPRAPRGGVIWRRPCRRRCACLSANLWNGRADPAAFIEVIEREAADVVVTQEMTPEQADALGAAMPYAELFPARNHNGMGVAMRRPGVFTRVPVPHRDALSVRFEAGTWADFGAPFEVVNVHVMAPHVYRPHVGLRWRGPQMNALEGYLGNAAADQRVVLGDFNATPSWPVYWRMAAQSTDAAVAVAEATGTRVRATWGPWHGSPRLARIDHAFVSGVEVVDFRVVSVPGADHSAIVVEVACAAAAGTRGD